MKYSSGLAAKSFWYLESKKTARYMMDGLKREEIQQLAVEENIYQVESESQALKIANNIYNRLNSLTEHILEDIVNSDLATSKILVLISIMKTDKLFFEFMHEVFKIHIILGDYYLKNRDINIFFQEKKFQSEIISNWAESTIKRLIRSYTGFLNQSGLLNVNKNCKIIVIPFIDYRVKQRLIHNNMAPYLYTVTGEK